LDRTRPPSSYKILTVRQEAGFRERETGRGQGSRCEVESGDRGRSRGQRGVEMRRGQGSRCEVESGIREGGE